jgi:hypothetical protein
MQKEMFLRNPDIVEKTISRQISNILNLEITFCKPKHLLKDTWTQTGLSWDA